MLKKCFEYIKNNVESDCEDGGATYYLSYENGKVKFIRSTSFYTGDYDDYGYGLVEVQKSYSRPIFEEECSLVDFTNMVIKYANNQCEYHYDYGSSSNIHFKPIIK